MKFLTSVCITVLISATLFVSKSSVFGAEFSGLQHKCQVEQSPPDLKVQTFSYSTCILMKIAAYFKTPEGDYIDLGEGKVNSAISSCETKKAAPFLQIDFKCGVLAFEFGRNENGTTFTQTIGGQYLIIEDAKYFYSPISSYFKTNAENHYYKCDAEQSIADEKSEGTLFISNFAYELYRDSSSLDFQKQPEVCAIDAVASTSA